MPAPRLVVSAVVAAVAALLVGQVAAAASTATTGYDVSYPQCSSILPRGAAFGIVGVNDGIAWSANPCLTHEFAWAAALGTAPAFYMNTANPGPASVHWNLGGPQACVDPTSASDPGCAYDYGWNAAAYALQQAVSATSAAAAAGGAWWSDVETANSWNGDAAANAADVQGGVDYLRSQGVAAVGIYSTAYQWTQVTGGYKFAPSPATPDWVAGAPSARQAGRWCASASTSFSGGPVALVQYPAGGFNADLRC